MYVDIKNFVLSCHSCVSRRGHVRNPPAPLQRIPVATRPFERIAMDAVGPLTTSALGNKYLLVLTDYFTRYPEAYPVPNIQTATVVDVLERFICTHGVPEIIITDRGSNFISDAITRVYEKLGITKIHTSSYHPQSDGVCERLNATLINSLSHLVSETGEDWCRHVHFALLAHRTTLHAATGEAPAYLLHGRDLTLPVQLLSQPPQRTYTDTQEYVRDLSLRLKTAFESVKRNLQKAAEGQENQRKKSAKDKGIRVGDFVYCYFPNSGGNLCRKFQRKNKGPFRVIRQTSPVNYELQSVDNPGSVIRAHVDRLRKVPLVEENIVARNESTDEVQNSDEVQSGTGGNRYSLRPRDGQGFVRIN